MQSGLVASHKKTRKGSNWNAEYDFKRVLDIFDALGKIHRMYRVLVC